ncbi:MAG: zinc ribbon domain-containing protein [Lachnospiraceae bacterium]|nr:zinc ribbon domain-containing protein [Lachnospiraceae bacterium]MDE6981766.1 zinc ribbon domain-containing protein [Lachnospiraceae bacterium]
MNNEKRNRLLLYIGILIILLLIFLRFGLYFLKSDGFSGLSMVLPLLLLCFILFALCTSALFAAWVYQDCKRRGDDPVLWAIVVFAATPFIGLLIYFLRRSEIKTICPACGRRISVKAKYCEECGTHVEKEDHPVMVKQGTHHLKFIIAGIVSMVLMLVCLTGFIVSAASGNNINTNAASNDRVWNLGTIRLNYNTYVDDVWKLDFRSASKGFVKEQNMAIRDAGTQMLYADISCGTVPDSATLVMWLVQGDVVKSIDVTNLSEPLEYPLNEFENGKVYVRLQINGVKNTVSEICIQ